MGIVTILQMTEAQRTETTFQDYRISEAMLGGGELLNDYGFSWVTTTLLPLLGRLNLTKRHAIYFTGSHRCKN